MERSVCVICNSHVLEEIYILKEYPITPSSSALDSNSDEFQDCAFMNCIQCGCVQLKTLIDPFKLYSNSHNTTDASPTWNEHHRLFSEFIKNNTNDSKLLEVGGNSGSLYRLLKSNEYNYTILDICDSDTRPRDITFIQGNCETFNYNGYNTVILSHTFEHLYTPIQFIECLRNSRVQSVLISIPNMDSLFSSKNISILNNEHTFFIGDAEVRYLFSQYQYSCKASYDFRNHSRFYHFVYDTNTIKHELSVYFNRASHIQSFFLAYEESMKSIIVDTPCFICPAGHYGQKLYYYLQASKKNIKGFIDNDPLKQGKRVYGTPVYVYSPDILKTYRETTIYMILYAGPYVDELKLQLNRIHPKIIYVSV